MNLRTARAFFDTYTAGAQRAASEEDERGWRRRLVGAMRFDAIVCESIVVPDTHLLDGRFFLDVRPSDLVNLVGRDATARQLPIEVRTRARTRDLDDALADLLRRPGSDTLNGFEFNSIEDVGTRSVVADALAALPAEELDRQLASADGRAFKGVASLLRLVLSREGLDESAVDRLEEGWAFLVENSDLFTIEPWSGEFNLAQALLEDPLDPSDLASDLGQDVLRRILDQVTHDTERGVSPTRANARRLLRDAESEVASVDESFDLNTIQGWYTLGRHRAIAHQYRCNLGGTISINARATSNARRLLLHPDTSDDQTPRIELPSAFLDRVGSMSGDQYRRACGSMGSDLSLWWDERDLGSLRRVTASLAKVAELEGVEVGGRADALFSQVFTVAGGAFVVAATATAVGQPIPVSLAGSGVAAGAAAVPFLRRHRGTRRLMEYLNRRRGE